MLRKIRRCRPSHATIVAYVALFVALAGSSYAAITLSKNSVKSKHIARHQVKGSDLARDSVKSSKVTDGSLSGADFAAGQLPAGATGERGAQGPRGPEGQQGPTGVTGPAGSPDTPQQVVDKLVQADGSGSTVDADTLDGINSLNVARLAGGVFANGNPTNIGYTSAKSPPGATGVYRIDFPAGSFKTSNSCKTPTPMVVARSDTPVIATIADGTATCSAADGSGGFTVRTFNAAGAAVDAAIWFIVI
jgi:hypothetical protein